MTVEVMAKVERRYSRKVGDSFRRDREHLALFEELSMHEDLDSSLAAMDSNVPSAFEASAQGDTVLEMDTAKSDDDWLVTIPEVPLSPKPVQQSVVTNDNLSSIRTSRSISRAVEPAAAAPRRNASPSKSPRPGPSLSSSKSPRPVFTTSTKSPRPTTASYNSRSSSSPRSTSTKSSSPRLFTPSTIRSSSPSTRRSSSASRATIATAAKATSAVKSSSPTYSRASTVTSSPGRRASTGNLGKGPLLAANGGTPSTGSTKTFVRGASPSARGSSSPARSGTGWSPSPSVSSTNTRGTSPARSGFTRGTSPSRGGSSPARSVSSTTNRKPSPTRRNSSPATPEYSSVTSGRTSSIARKARTPETVEKPHNFASDFPAETPANLRTSSFKRGSGSPGSLISRSYDDPSNSRRQSASSADFDSYLSKSHDRGSAYLSGSRPGSRDQSPNNNLSRSHDGGSKRSLDRDPISSARATSVGGFSSQPYPNRRASTGDHRIPSRNVTVSEYGLDGRRISKGSKEMPLSPKVGHNLGRATTLQQDPAFESSFMRRSSDTTASRSVGYSGGFKPFMTNNSIPSFNSSISSSLHRKHHQLDAQPADSVSPPMNEEMAPAGTEESSKVDQKNAVKRTQMGFALKKEDVVSARTGPEIEAQPNRTELGSKSPRLTSLVVSQGPVKIYQGLGDIEDMGANWCCGMDYQYRGFCKQHECGIYKNFHDALVVPNSKPASKKNAEDGKDAESENVVVDSSTAPVNRKEEVAGIVSDANRVDMESADSVVKSKIQQLKCRQEEEVDCNSDPSISDAIVERRKKSKEGSDQQKGPRTLPSCDPSETIMMSPVSVCESETSEDALPVDALSPTSPSVGEQNRHLRSDDAEAAIRKDFNWELDTLESPSRPLKSPDFFQVSKRHGEVAISRVQSFNASEFDGEETEMADGNVTDLHTGATKVHPSESDSEDTHENCDVIPHSSKTAEVTASTGPRSELERAMDRVTAQRVDGVENVQLKESPRAPDDSNVSPPEKSHIIPQKPAKLFPFVKSPKDAGYYKRDVSMMSSKISGVSRISSTSATSIDLTRSVDTTCSAHSQYDNALWDDPNYSGRFGDPLAGIPYKSIATLPLPLPVEVRCMESPGAVLTSSGGGPTAPDGEMKMPRYNDGLEKLAGYMRSASINARKRRILPSSEDNSKMHSRESSFDYFVDFLDSQPDLDLDGGGLTDALVSAHKEAKKLENSPGANNNLRFIKRLDSRLSNNSLISDKSYESRATDMSSDSSWESGKNRGQQPLDAACQVMEQIVENANALSHGRHLSSFKFGQKKTAATLADLEVGSESPPESDYGPSPARRKHSKQLSSATSDSSQKSAKHYDERIADGRVLPALKSTPGIIIMSDKSPDDDAKFNSPPRESTNDLGDLDGNLWEAVQIMEEEQEMEAELTPPAPIEFATRDFTPARTPARTPSRTPARTPSRAGSKASSSHGSQHSQNMGVTRSPSLGSKASSKHLDSDDGELHTDFTASRHGHRSYCGCSIL